MKNLAAHGKRVAVCGCGISGSLVSNVLAKYGFEVHTFEGGRGPGGRSSTRRYGEANFDHGAQFIKEPVSKPFRTLMDEWISAGIIAEWKGQFGKFSQKSRCFTSQNESISSAINENARGSDCIAASESIVTGTGHSNFSAETRSNGVRRFVGTPKMNSICNYLLDSSPQIISTFSTTIKAVPILETPSNSNANAGIRGWEILEADSDKSFGTFDWLITTDRWAYC